MTKAQSDIIKYHRLIIINPDDKLDFNKRYIFKDDDGYKYRTSITVLTNAKRRNNPIRRFFGGNPFTKQNINLYLSINNLNIYLLDSFDMYKYKNARSSLNFICFKHGVFTRSWNDVYSNNTHCQICGDIKFSKNKRNSYDYVYEYCKNVGFKLLSKHYGNNEHSLYVECAKHGKIKTAFGYIISNKFICNECYLDSIRKPVENIEDVLIRHELTLIDDTPNINNQVLLFCHKCNNNVRHAFQYIQSSNFKCRECKKIDGEIKPSRDGDTSKDWRRLVYEKHDYKCDICNGKGKNNVLNAHHLNSWHWYIDGRFDVDNGVCLCPTHHEEFHKIYTYFNNTEEQYIEYKQEKTETKF